MKENLIIRIKLVKQTFLLIKTNLNKNPIFLRTDKAFEFANFSEIIISL